MTDENVVGALVECFFLRPDAWVSKCWPSFEILHTNSSSSKNIPTASDLFPFGSMRAWVRMPRSPATLRRIMAAVRTYRLLRAHRISPMAGQPHSSPGAIHQVAGRNPVTQQSGCGLVAGPDLFRRQHFRELRKPEGTHALQQLYQLMSRNKPVTLLFASTNLEHNNAVASGASHSSTHGLPEHSRARAGQNR